MAPQPPNSTSRLKVFYEGPNGNHTMLFHQQDGSTIAALSGQVRDVLLQLAPLVWNETSFFKAEYALSGSGVFLPFGSWTPINGSGGAFAPTDRAPSTFLQWGGRGDDGVRVKFYLFETLALPNQQMRFQEGAVAAIDATLAALRGTPNVIGTASGSTPAWYSYVNVGQNDYLTRKARS